MKTTDYFRFTRSRPDRAAIQEEWILETLNNPLREEVQTDGRIRKWKYIGEAEKYLRIVVLEDGETIHNAFFDRGFREH